ncbi:hypothetical protein [Novosphingobium sp. ES2-1]|uniref:hypothetical protein n=1 Tax=Novosphingobium sp. ES2-1 TaxID=2780074 RepID=UPI001882BC95|nr:hypothetical protein [Novosphingobium sp. ES2-1]QOV93645.1 hypothetical protein IM701_13785 [Novosphingobium sp. ES2-1]
MEPAAYIRRETAVSIAVNVALSAAFFIAVFGTGRDVPVWSVGGYVFDFAPQGFMIGLMATLVPACWHARPGRRARCGLWTVNRACPQRSCHAQSCAAWLVPHRAWQAQPPC